MDPLTWTGPLGQILDPALGVIAALFTLALVAQIVMSVASAGERVVTNPDGTLSSSQGAYGTARMATKYTGLALVIILLAYIGLGAKPVFAPYTVEDSDGRQFSTATVRAGLMRLIAQYQRPTRFYTSRRAML